MVRAAFIDKDGTLLKDIPYNVDVRRIEFNPGAMECLALLKNDGFKLIMISNQSGVARGLFNLNDLEKVSAYLQSILGPLNAAFDGFYFCPHHPCGIVDKYSIDCNCRKPNPGLIVKAAHDFNIDLSASWMIGDILDDIEAGNRAGCQTMLLNNGNETEWLTGEFRQPAAVVRDLREVPDILMSHLNRTIHGARLH